MKNATKTNFGKGQKVLLPIMNCVNTLVLQRNKATMKKDGVLILPCTAVGYKQGFIQDKRWERGENRIVV